MRRLRAPIGAIPRGFTDHRSVAAKKYRVYCLAIQAQWGPLPAIALPTLREAGRAAVELERLGHEHELAIARKQRREAGRITKRQFMLREQLARLDWTYLSGGHGNVGAKADIEFYRDFLADLKRAVGRALGEVPWGTGVDAAKVNAHTPFLPAWLGAVAKKATEELRPKYGAYYGFEAGTPRNAEMVAQAMFSYK